MESLTREHQELLAAVSHLESQVAGAKSLLERERKNCKLLMDCPFVDPLKKESWEQLHSASVSDPKATRKQISANTVRILMLEEQNSELRSLSVRPGQRQTEQFEVTKHLARTAHCISGHDNETDQQFLVSQNSHVCQ